LVDGSGVAGLPADCGRLRPGGRGKLLTLSASLDETGDLKALGLATRDLRPGFRYALISVPREGVKTVNGKELPK
jgi:hypothetical protein